MKKFWCVGALIGFLFCAVQVGAQALTLGTVSMAGNVKVTGPGGMFFTGAEGNAPLFPGSAVEVVKGQALINLAGKGTIVPGEASKVAFPQGVPYFEKGAFEVKVFPGQEMVMTTPQGRIVARAGDKPASLRVILEGGRTRVLSTSGGLALSTQGKVSIYSLERGEYVLRGEEFSYTGRGEVWMASSSKGLPIAASAGGVVAGGAGASVMLPIALGISGVTAATMVVTAKNGTTNHHHRVASPSSP